MLLLTVLFEAAVAFGILWVFAVVMGSVAMALLGKKHPLHPRYESGEEKLRKLGY